MRCSFPPNLTLSLHHFQSLCDVCLLGAHTLSLHHFQSLCDVCLPISPYALVASLSVSMRCSSPLSPTLSLCQFPSLCDIGLIPAQTLSLQQFRILWDVGLPHQALGSRCSKFRLYARMFPASLALSLHLFRNPCEACSHPSIRLKSWTCFFPGLATFASPQCSPLRQQCTGPHRQRMMQTRWRSWQTASSSPCPWRSMLTRSKSPLSS